MVTLTYYNKNAQELTDSEIPALIERKETFFIHSKKSLVEVSWDTALTINLPALLPETLAACASLHKWFSLDKIAESICILEENEK